MNVATYMSELDVFSRRPRQDGQIGRHWLPLTCNSVEQPVCPHKSDEQVLFNRLACEAAGAWSAAHGPLPQPMEESSVPKPHDVVEPRRGRSRRHVRRGAARALLAAAVAAVAAGPGAVTARPIVFTRVPAGIEGGAVLATGSAIARFDPSRPGDGVTVLTRGFAAAGRPDVSFDGHRILFVARRVADDPVEVWEMNADGTRPRRVTRAGGCTAAIYLSTIYTMDAERPVHQLAFSSGTGPRSLYTCRLDGSRVRRITFNPDGAADPCALAGGRILYSSGVPPEPGGGDPLGDNGDDRGSTALFTVNTDGTDVFPFADGDLPAAQRSRACETTGGWVAYIEAPAGSREPGGAVVAVSSTAGRRSRRLVTPEPSGLYRCPSPLDDDTVLVSYRRRDGGSWGIHTLGLSPGSRPSRVIDEPGWDELDAVALRPRPEPAGRSSVVDDQLDTGRLYCLNTYLSGTRNTRENAGVEIESLAVFTVAPSGVGQELLGLVPVEPDGSMYAIVPARTPLRLQSLDAQGRVVRTMRSWFWVMPREARGCIGCHEDRELTPPNRHVLSLRGKPHVIGRQTEGGVQ